MNQDSRNVKVIHTRIPAALEEQVKRLAEGLRVPVSNFVRNALEDAIEMTRRVHDKIPDPSGPAANDGPRSDLSEVFGWQTITLNMPAPCARCGQNLRAGDAAYLGLTDRPRNHRVFICSTCLPRSSRARNQKQGVSHGRQG